MSLLIVYLALMITGDFVAYLVGLAVERSYPQASLAVFLGMYFVMLWVSWIVAVKLTEPRMQPR